MYAECFDGGLIVRTGKLLNMQLSGALKHNHNVVFHKGIYRAKSPRCVVEAGLLRAQRGHL